MLNKFKALFVEEEGQGMAEYGLILGLIAVVVIVVLTAFGQKIKSLFTNLSNATPDGTNG
jgi:pilus assembly protein Flp/PilA